MVFNTYSFPVFIGTIDAKHYSLFFQDGSKNEREVDNSDDAALANQKRMNADPLEVMLMNMGYRLSSSEDGDGDRERSNDQAQVTCPTS